MSEYFVTSRSFAAPFFSDAGEKYVEADDPETALLKYVAEYKHPAGLYAAEVWESADAYHKNADFLAQWLSNHVIALREATKDKPSYLYDGIGPGDFKIDDEHIHVENPKDGAIVHG